MSLSSHNSHGPFTMPPSSYSLLGGVNNYPLSSQRPKSFTRYKITYSSSIRSKRAGYTLLLTSDLLLEIVDHSNMLVGMLPDRQRLKDIS